MNQLSHRATTVLLSFEINSFQRPTGQVYQPIYLSQINSFNLLVCRLHQKFKVFALDTQEISNQIGQYVEDERETVEDSF